MVWSPFQEKSASQEDSYIKGLAGFSYITPDKFNVFEKSWLEDYFPSGVVVDFGGKLVKA